MGRGSLGRIERTKMAVFVPWIPFSILFTGCSLITASGSSVTDLDLSQVLLIARGVVAMGTAFRAVTGLHSHSSEVLNPSPQ